MDLSEGVRRELFAAGADAVVFNSPLSASRADRLVDALKLLAPSRVVDLGCGQGQLSRRIAERMSHATVIGVDSDHRSIQVARSMSVGPDVANRLEFEVGDAESWSGSVNGSVCVGVSHAFGGPTKMLDCLARLIPAGGSAVVGDAVWESAPDAWCVEQFGSLPQGVEGLAGKAARVDWDVVDADSSTRAEWDEFEHGWVSGVRSVGTQDAAAFADHRELAYRKYRGVLGFGWLVLSRRG